MQIGDLANVQLVKALIFHLQIMNLKLFPFSALSSALTIFRQSLVLAALKAVAVYSYFMGRKFLLLRMNGNSNLNVISREKWDVLIAVELYFFYK